MNYGTLTVKREENEEIIQIDVEDNEVGLFFSRLIPSHDIFPFTVKAHTDNVRLIRMVMREYPLEIKTRDAWKSLLNGIREQKKQEKKLETLVPIEPSRQKFIGELFPFQKLGLDFMLKAKGMALLADEMGLGKTIQTLAFISKRPDSVPAIIVAPLVTLYNWKREIEKFLRLECKNTLCGDSLQTPRVEVIRSGKKKPGPAEFYIINYEMLMKQVPHLKQTNPKMIVYDEIQNLRNTDTYKFKSCRALAQLDSVRYRLGLSGTPVYNRGTEMYGIANIIRPGVLGDYEEFKRRYCTPYVPNRTEDDKRTALSKVLRKSIMIRRKKTDVLRDLPEKIRMQQRIQIDTEFYEEELGKLYERIEEIKDCMGELETEDGKKEGLFSLNKKIREMRVAERQIAGIAKAPHIINYVTSLLDDYEEEKFVIFAHHRMVHQILLEGLRMYNPLQIIGGQSDKKRQEAIDRFQTEKECRVIICGLRAGNVGINLTSAAYVIFAELDWSPSIHRQAEDRLHRIGQKKSVFSHYLVGTGTFDEMLADVLADKTLEIGNVLGDKLEGLDNTKALKFLEDKFKIRPGFIADDMTSEKNGKNK